MMLVASENGAVGMEPAWQALLSGASALDAVEIGVRHAEANPDDHTVGYAGHPNVAGVVQLDASIMDGAGRCRPAPWERWSATGMPSPWPGR